MRFWATEEQVRKMCALAVNASAHWLECARPDGPREYTEADFRGEVDGRFNVSLDYFDGRMVKLHMRRTGARGDAVQWEVPDRDPRPDYQAWCGAFPTYRALAEKVGAECEPERDVELRRALLLAERHEERIRELEAELARWRPRVDGGTRPDEPSRLALRVDVDTRLLAHANDYHGTIVMIAEDIAKQVRAKLHESAPQRTPRTVGVDLAALLLGPSR
jgi:hypothetical protein